MLYVSVSLLNFKWKKKKPGHDLQFTHSSLNVLNHQIYSNFKSGQSELFSSQTGSMTAEHLLQACQPNPQTVLTVLPTWQHQASVLASEDLTGWRVSSFWQHGRPAVLDRLRAKNQSFHLCDGQEGDPWEIQVNFLAEESQLFYQACSLISLLYIYISVSYTHLTLPTRRTV